MEALLQDLSDVKGLVLKCLEEGEDSVAEVVAVPRTLFEQYLNGQMGDSGDEEQDDEADDLDEKENARAPAFAAPLATVTQGQVIAFSSIAQRTVPASTSATVAPATAPVVAAPTAVQVDNAHGATRRRRLEPEMASTFQ